MVNALFAAPARVRAVGRAPITAEFYMGDANTSLHKTVQLMSTAELVDAYQNIDKMKFAARAIALHKEIARRKAHGIAGPSQPPAAASQAPAADGRLALAFHGTAHAYFRIWIENLCLTLLTLGVFSAWAKVRKKRFVYAHTTLDGTPFEYLGKPIPILKGRILAVAVFAAYYLSSHPVTSERIHRAKAGALPAPGDTVPAD